MKLKHMNEKKVSFCNCNSGWIVIKSIPRDRSGERKEKMSEYSEPFGCVDGVCSVFPEVECVSFCGTEEKNFVHLEKENLTQ